MGWAIFWALMYCAASATVITDVVVTFFGHTLFSWALNLMLSLASGIWLGWYIDFKPLVEWMFED